LNVGGAWPGRYDMATQGSPAKFSYCIAENEAASPWGPMAAGDTVTVYGGEPPHNVNDHVSTTASGSSPRSATPPSRSAATVGWYFSQSQLLVVLGPEHAKTVADDGFTRADVQRFVYEHARLSLGHLKLGGMWGCTTGRLDERGDRSGGAHAAGAVAGRRLCRHRRGVGQALGGHSKLHFSRAVSRPIRTGRD